MLNGLETSLRLTKPNPDGSVLVTRQKIEEAFQRKYTLYDKGGDQHYDIISAFIKSVRGSDPDGALYWLAIIIVLSVVASWFPARGATRISVRESLAYA